ncbi:MAG: DUF2125 domain-containing protein [Pseudomonadota bacterium]
MSASNPKPAYNAGRRIKWLMGAIFAFAAVYSAAWFYAASEVDSRVADEIDGLQAQGVSVNCADRDVRGYPFRMGVFCSDFDAEIESGQVSINGGQLRSAAQVYDPRRLLVEVDAPLRITTPNQQFRLDYDVGQAVIEARDAGQRAGSVEFVDGALSDGQVTARWDRLTVFSRESDGNLEIAVQSVALGLDTVPLPALAIDLDAAIENASYDDNQLRGRSGSLRRLTVRLGEDRGLIVEGPFNVSDAGLLNANLSARFVDIDGIVSDLEATSPQIAAALQGMFATRPRTGEKGDEVEMELVIKDGQIRLGFFTFEVFPAF